MGTLKKYVFGHSKQLPPNTFIGGVSASISTPALLGTKLGISESRITNFVVMGSDISCNINGSYGIPGNAFQFNVAPCTYYRDTDYLVTSVGESAFYALDTIDTIQRVYDFENCTTVNNISFRRSNASKIFLKNITTLPANSLDQNAYIKALYIPNATTLGTSPSVNNSVLSVGQNYIIYANPFLQTSNSGGVEADLAAAIAGGATVRYVTNFTAPNPVTTLNTGLVYASAIQLTFTPPSSTNAIDYYEVYVNGVYKNDITASGGYATGLTASTNYNISVVAVDIFYNKSVVSNNLNASTVAVNPSDADASLFITNASIVDTTQQNAINDFVINLKIYNLWSKKKAIYPFVGGTASRHKFNLKNPLDTDAAFRLTYTGTITHSATGLLPSSGSYADTKLNLLSNFPDFLTNGCISFYSRTQTPSGDGWNVGVGNTANGNPLWGIAFRRSDNNLHYDRGNISNNGRITTTTTDARGLIQGNTNSASSAKIFINGVLKTSSVLTAVGTPSNANVYIGTCNPTSGLFYYLNNECAYMAIGDALTDEELVNEYQVVQAFQTLLSRQV